MENQDASEPAGPKSIYERWADRGEEYQEAVSKRAEMERLGDLYQTAYFKRPHHDLVMLCVSQGTLTREGIEGQFGTEGVQVAEELADKGLFDRSQLGYNPTPIAREIHANFVKLLERRGKKL